jgi:hypothetical protein
VDLARWPSDTILQHDARLEKRADDSAGHPQNPGRQCKSGRIYAGLSYEGEAGDDFDADDLSCVTWKAWITAFVTSMTVGEQTTAVEAVSHSGARGL